jgi:hypothetical protein
MGNLEQILCTPRQKQYEEDVCDTSGSAAVAVRGFSSERRADF